MEQKAEEIHVRCIGKKNQLINQKIKGGQPNRVGVETKETENRK